MKKVTGYIKLQIPAGKATPAPPVGPALGQAGVNIMDFCKAFNAKTAKDEGLIIPVVITVYADRSYTFITKTPPVAILIKREAGIAKGSGEPNRNKVGKITMKQVEAIAKLKMPDLTAGDLEGRGPDRARDRAQHGRRGLGLAFAGNDVPLRTTSNGLAAEPDSLRRSGGGLGGATQHPRTGEGGSARKARKE